ncbi:hypothetical protein NUW58_g6878 [Xylaria curta]|uniref:Uncharacterized protein n=1 Tax=Xylaria curta TaxID=42375 RepID=A0ACC1NN06_9PEZI|nr:hypothetical protein NUW58_g6878 [Xylaria curta]
MGVNPLVSMLLSIASTSPAAGGGGGLEVHFLYSLRDPGAGGEGRRRREARNMLFLERISRVFRQGKVRGSLEVFLTGGGGEGQERAEGERVIHCRDGGNGDGDGDEYIIPFHARRCTVDDDIAKALGSPAERRFAVVYVCGVPTMTDQFVARLTDHRSGLGLEPHRVLCEKWW